MSRNKLYFLLAAACTTGFLWLLLNTHKHSASGPDICLFKAVAGFPCPSCGSTRAILALFHGDFIAAVQWNPLGLLITMIMVLSPLWIVYDLLSRRATLLVCYIHAEILLRRRKIALPVILLLIANWGWNIYKGF